MLPIRALVDLLAAVVQDGVGQHPDPHHLDVLRRRRLAGLLPPPAPR